jgi:hypothetical protein
MDEGLSGPKDGPVPRTATIRPPVRGNREERAQNLVCAARGVSYRGLRPFLSPEYEYPPVQRQAVLEAIWPTPADELAHSILE